MFILDLLLLLDFTILHANDIKRAVGEIASYHKKDYLSPFFLVLVGCAFFGLSLAFPFCFLFDVFSH